MITNFIVENYRSIDGEIRLSFMADTGIKDMDNRDIPLLQTLAFLTPRLSMEPTLAVNQMCSRLLE